MAENCSLEFTDNPSKGLAACPQDKAALTSQLQQTNEDETISNVASNKSPISDLNEYALKNKLVVKFEECNEQSDSVLKFACLCIIDGTKYPQGTGRSKKEAKTNAAKIAFYQVSSNQEDVTSGLTPCKNDQSSYPKQPVNPAYQQQPLSPAYQKEPVSQTYQQQPVSQTSLQQPVSQTSLQQPVSQTSLQQPVSQTSLQQPVSQTSLQQSVSQTSLQQPVSQTSLQQPVSLTSLQQPVSQISLQQPVSQTSLQQPVSQTSLQQPVSQTSLQQPVSQTSLNQLVSQTSLQTSPKLLVTPRWLSDLIKLFYFGKKQPISCINEYAAMNKLQVQYQADEVEKDSISAKFTCTCIMDGTRYTRGLGANKKEAKTNAARNAFTEVLRLYNKEKAGSPLGMEETLPQDAQTMLKSIASESLSEEISDQRSLSPCKSDQSSLSSSLQQTVSPKSQQQPVGLTSLKQPVSLTSPKQPISLTSPKQPVSLTSLNQPVSLTSLNQPVNLTSPKQPVSLTSPKQPVIPWSVSNLIELFLSGNKQPISCINEYAAMNKLQVQYQADEVKKDSISVKFTCTCIMDGKHYPQGDGANKKEAKTNAARKAFTEVLRLYNKEKAGSPVGMEETLPQDAETVLKSVASESLSKETHDQRSKQLPDVNKLSDSLGVLAFSVKSTDAEKHISELDWFDEIPMDRKKNKMSEQDLSGIAESLGDGWQFLAINLGLKMPQIDQAKITGDTMLLHIVRVLIKWKQCRPNEATFETIVKSLREVNNTCTIDWDQVKKVVKGKPAIDQTSTCQSQAVGKTYSSTRQPNENTEFKGFPTHPLNQLKKEIDDTEDLTHLGTVVDFGKSVGRIVTPFFVGTGFRVGERYIMTVYHLFKSLIEGFDMTSGSHLSIFNKSDVYIDFDYKEGEEINMTTKYSFCNIIYCNPHLDTLVLELSLFCITPPPQVTFTPFNSDNKITFVGHNHGRNKKRDPKCSIVEPTLESIQAGNAFCTSVFGIPGYDGLWDANFERFHCNFEKGASGAPGVVFDTNGKALVMIMLLKGYPSFYWDLQPDQQNRFPKTHLLEEGVSMQRIAEDMKLNNEAALDLVFC